MFEKPCYRTLDRPLSILGLEPGDLVITVLVALIVFAGVSQILGIGLGLGLGFGLKRLKRGQPPGHLFYLAYRFGIVRFLPTGPPALHLVRPPLPWESPTAHFSAFEGDRDHERPEIRFYHRNRRLLA
jgi:hypothetical protein